ncbi:hypothetical protein Cgig2_018559 [Carnegiea gigantea]|uniref:Uncharacterized protein n=1 Tax=Carnegiea gigantea TaxID=171969 RepID=A0A9Q1QK48_9CARY|nr:hypothetical protein Cgig2_018559 [Carnegiea gigantea]
MSVDDIVVEIHHRGKFVDRDKVEYVGDMADVAAVNKRLVVYLVHTVDVPKEVVPEMPALPCPSTATQLSNEDPRPESLIPWDKLIEGNSLNEESDDSEYVPETEIDLEAFEDIAGSISKARGKRKINVGGGVDDDGCENDGDEHVWDTNIEDEWEADVEDLETSDEEWAAARAKVGECKKQKGSRKIDNAQQVGK